MTGYIWLAVDNSFTTPFKTELEQLRQDLIGDGWRVRQHDIVSTTNDTTLKNWVISEFNKPGAVVKSLLIIGHFAIPYSGNFAPDGHTERIGAQPADIFYADIDGAWTDSTVTTNNNGFIYTPNEPNDGNWDQSILPLR